VAVALLLALLVALAVTPRWLVRELAFEFLPPRRRR
jgi:hypothetical protein